ncbi:MAG: extracellular solute-binding protein, partial [Clostridia bacterium]|nr:extracellular solute-binding protein [Clostridia bacterium]
LEKSIEMGYLAAIDDLPGGADLIEPLKEYLVEGSTTLDGKTYLLPYAATTRGLIYNKDMFKAAGIVDEKGEPKAPETLAELREVAKKLTDTSKNQFGIIFPMKWGNWFASDIYALKQSATGFTDFNYETGEYDLTGLDKIMEVFLGIKKDGSFYPGAESIDNDTARAHFAEGNIGMKFAFSFDVGVLNDQFPAKCDWGVAPLPVLDKNEKYMQRMTMNSTPYINSAVLNDSKKAEAVAEVLRFLTSDEFLTEIYISGINIPIRSDVIEKADESKIDRKGWVDFANMVAISKLLQPTPKKQGIVKKSITDRFIQDVWTGKMSPKQMIDEVDAETEEQREAYLKKDPSDKTENYIIPDWIQKR